MRERTLPRRSWHLLRLTLAAAAASAALVQPAQAGLFEDDEARRFIIELRTRVQANEDAAKQRHEQLNQQTQEQLQTLRRSLLDLSGQIDILRGEMAKLRGTNEQLARDLSETQRKLVDQTQSVEARLKPLEPQKVSIDGREFQVSPDEQSQYEAAIGLVRRGDFAEAVAALNSYLKRFPGSGYTDSVRFWLGNAQYGKRDYKDAIATFKTFVANNADHPRTPEALLAMANCQIELKDNRTARRTLDDLIKAYPRTEAAQAAKERRAALK